MANKAATLQGGLTVSSSAGVNTFSVSDAGAIAAGPAGSANINLKVNGSMALENATDGTTRTVYFQRTGRTSYSGLRFTDTGDFRASFDVLINTAQSDSTPVSVANCTAGGAWTLGPNETSGLCQFNYDNSGSSGGKGIRYAFNQATRTQILVRNNQNDSSGKAEFVCNGYGNSWAIGMGHSSSALGNALYFQLDPNSPGIVAASCTTAGAWTFGPPSGLTTEHLFRGSVATAGTNQFRFSKLGLNKNTVNNYYCSFTGANGDDGYLWVNGSGVFTTGDDSDARLKKNIRSPSYGMSTINELRPVEFDWIDGPGNVKGFIAQEVREVLPESVSMSPSGYLAMEMQTMIPVLVKAVQELSAKLDAANARNDALEARLAALEAK